MEPRPSTARFEQGLVEVREDAIGGGTQRDFGAERNHANGGPTFWADRPGISAEIEDGDGQRPIYGDTAIARGS